MKQRQLPNASASKITITSTATSLADLIQTAAGEDYLIPSEINAVDFFSETNDFRYFADGNTPTSLLGIPVSEGDVFSLRGVSADRVKLIRSGASDATATVQIGVINPV